MAPARGEARTQLGLGEVEPPGRPPTANGSYTGPIPTGPRRSPEELAAYVTAETPEPMRGMTQPPVPEAPAFSDEVEPRAPTPIYPRAASRPPFLASSTNMRQMAPFEPWAEPLPALMAMMGALLILTFIAPWSVPANGDTLFAWDAIRAAEETGTKLFPILVASVGALVLLLGILPVTTTARAVATAAAAALVAIAGISMEAGYLADFSGVDTWRFVAVLGGVLVMPVGLLVRSRYPASLASRILVSLGGLSIALAYLVPAQDDVLLFSLLTATGGTTWEWLVRAVLLAPFLLGALAPMVWLPRTVTRGAAAHAWALIGWLPLAHAAGAFAESARAGDWTLAIRTPGFTFVPAGVALATGVLLAYGGAQLIGKRLERPGQPSH